MRRATLYLLAIVGAGWLAACAASPADALSLDATYFKIDATPSVNADVNHGNFAPNPFFGLQQGLVGPLGTGLTLADGLPTPAVGKWTNLSFGGGVGLWSTDVSSVTKDVIGGFTDVNGHRTDPFGFSFASNFYAGASPTAGAQNDTVPFFRTVHWSGVFSAPTGATFSLQADDHAFLYIDSLLRIDDGGVKGVGVVPAETFNLGGDLANHTIDIFFADVFHVQSGIIFSCDRCLDPFPSTVPEPTTLLLFGTTLAGLGAVVRRRLRRADTSSAH
jgi:hypothetical protein